VVAAQEVFFETAKDGGKADELKESFEGAASKSQEELAILLDCEGRTKEFRVAMERVAKEESSEKRDEIIGARLFQVLFEDFFKTPKEFEPKKRMARAIDQIRERMVSYLAGKIVGQLGERGKSRSKEDWKREIWENLQESKRNQKPFSTLMVQSLGKTVEDGLNPLESFGAAAVGAVNFFGKALLGKKPVTIQVLPAARPE